jgi:hypothetical protein
MRKAARVMMVTAAVQVYVTPDSPADAALAQAIPPAPGRSYHYQKRFIY